MKKIWSVKWNASTQPRKQRKFRANAPLHIRHRFLSAHLSPDLRRQYKRRAFPLRKGDEVEVMRGESAGLRGAIAEVSLSDCRVRVDGMMVKKVDGSEVMKPLQPSNLMIVRLNTDDKQRLQALTKNRQPPKRPAAQPAAVQPKPAAVQQKPAAVQQPAPRQPAPVQKQPSPRPQKTAEKRVL